MPILPLILCVLTPVSQGPTYRVLVVGDSWADYMIDDGVLRATFVAHGFDHVWEKGDMTAVSGTTAADWVQPANLDLITAELNAHPTIEVVQLTVGGNDFLAGQSGGGWYLGMSSLEEEALFDRVAADIQTIIDHVHSHDPDLRILLSFYDYANFVETLTGLGAFICVPMHNDLGQPTSLELNEVQTRFTRRMEVVADGLPQVDTVAHLGMMQFTYGYPSMGIGPGELLPPGELTLPSPPESLRFSGADCFHLHAAGYRVLAENLWDNYYADTLCLPQALYGERQAAWPAYSITDLLWDRDRICEDLP